jgi:IS5 family transposase
LCSNGTGCPIKDWRRRFTTVRRCCGFAGIELNRDPVPDATTVLHFRYWLERHGLTRVLFGEAGAMLEVYGLLMRQGTIVDATIIAAPPWTRNKQKIPDRGCIVALANLVIVKKACLYRRRLIDTRAPPKSRGEKKKSLIGVDFPCTHKRVPYQRSFLDHPAACRNRFVHCFLN